jgi:hypothetical protein
MQTENPWSGAPAEGEAPDGTPVPHEPVLIIDETTAHLVAPGPRVGELLAWFRAGGVDCTLRLRGGVGGLDVVDFGNPSRSRERRIRELFARWQQRGHR